MHHVHSLLSNKTTLPKSYANLFTIFYFQKGNRELIRILTKFIQAKSNLENAAIVYLL